MNLDTALEKLGNQFAQRDWKFLDAPSGSPLEKSYACPRSTGGTHYDLCA